MFYHIQVKAADQKVWWYLSPDGTTRRKLQAIAYTSAVTACWAAGYVEFDHKAAGNVRVVDSAGKVWHEATRPDRVVILDISDQAEAAHE